MPNPSTVGYSKRHSSSMTSCANDLPCFSADYLYRPTERNRKVLVGKANGGIYRPAGRVKACFGLPPIAHLASAHRAQLRDQKLRPLLPELYRRYVRERRFPFWPALCDLFENPIFHPRLDGAKDCRQREDAGGPRRTAPGQLLDRDTIATVFALLST